MAFEPRCLIRQHRIGNRVRFVKTVACKLFYQIKNIFRQMFSNTIVTATRSENTTLLGHLFGFLFTHCAAQHIGSTQGITRKHLTNLHDLFLIDNHSIGRFKYRFQTVVLKIRMWIRDLLYTVLTIDKVIKHP